MNNNKVYTFSLLVILALTGCATSKKMALQDDKKQLTETSKAILLMTATLKNSYHKSYQPRMLIMHVEKPNAKESSDKINFPVDDKAKFQEDDSEVAGNSYLIRMELDAGNYEIRGITSRAKSFLTPGWFFTPLHSPIEIKDRGVFYLGHISAIVRERQGDEVKAGPTIPLLDQAAVGASGGTFDVEITDQFAKEEALFRSKFPALSGVKIQKTILPAFDRAKAQQWWEAH